MKVIIAGSREFNDYPFLCSKLDLFNWEDVKAILCGKAKGADSLGEQYALENLIPLEYYPANWEKYGKAAGYIRNKEMAEKGDILIAFWDSTSKGTKLMISLMEKLGKTVIVYEYKTNRQQTYENYGKL